VRTTPRRTCPNARTMFMGGIITDEIINHEVA
jgi:hypothetical protein